MRIEEKFESIEEFARLTPQDKELVLELYRKKEHPYQIEYKIWAIIIPSVLYGVAQVVFKEQLELSNIELLSLLIVAIVFFQVTLRFLESNLMAPKIVKKIISNLDEIKKASHQSLEQSRTK